MNRKSFFFKPASITLASVFLFQTFFPTFIWALSGPSQPETQSFTPSSIKELVDPFSGDFSYNIPLLDVGGYPINLSYNSGITMEQEASWVGLGWNINPGVINRNVRGLPDDFRGDKIQKTINVKENRTYGANISAPIEVFGIDFLKKLNLTLGIGASFNNYNGVGLDFSLSPSIAAGHGSKTKETSDLGIKPGFNLSIGTSGLSLSPSLSFSNNVTEDESKQHNLTASIGTTYNTRSGLQSVSFGSSYANSKKIKNVPSFLTRKNASSVISFASPTYTPSIENSYQNVSLSLAMSIIGSETYGSNFQANTSGYFSGQYLKEDFIETSSFGYLYTQDGDHRVDVMLDVNREKDLGYSKEINNLPVTSHTYDIFSVSGEGIGGSYRLFRNDVGTVADKLMSNNSGDLSLQGPEFAIGGAVKGGVNIAVNSSNSITAKWIIGNQTNSLLKFKNPQLSSDFEPVYFRKSGELNVLNDKTILNNFGGFSPISSNLESNTNLLSALKTYSTSSASAVSFPTTNSNTKRQSRNEAILYYTAKEAELFGLFDGIREYSRNQFELNEDGIISNFNLKSNYDSDQKDSRSRKKHHISELNVYSSGGNKYVYADPIYNFTKSEVTFATNEAGDLNGLVNYSLKDNSKANSKGLDNYYNKVVTPAYPTAFLLSAILSADFADIDDVKGPSDEDLGNYTKFNYTTTSEEYKWRTPFGEKKAAHSKGLYSNPGTKGDDKANYSYGVKELKYLHSIETKTHVAYFYLEDREDCFGVQSENGGIYSGDSSGKMQRLQKIELYSKADLMEASSATGLDAIPIKTVEFTYDYSQGSKYPNSLNSKGRLALKEVKFIYGNSNRGVLSPYIFDYGDPNPSTENLIDIDYNRQGSDRWGNYQPSSIGNDEFPYTNQSCSYDNTTNEYQFIADNYAKYWNLTNIKLPSGGEIEIEYEADDYAFVQNRKAMQMFKIKGFSNTINGTIEENTYTNSPALFTPLDYLVLDVPEGYNDNATIKDFFAQNNDYLSEIYFKMFVEAGNGSSYEYVTGYLSPDQIVSHSHWNKTNRELWLKMKRVEGENPITFATYNLLKRYFPSRAYGSPSIQDGALEQIFDALLSTVNSVKTAIGNGNAHMKLNSVGRAVDIARSWVRLYNPVGIKKGGGIRVKKVLMNDNWDEMTSNSRGAAIYGQEYDYTMIDDYGKRISSGVAAYEPMLGNEENPWRKPRFYDKKKLLVPDERMFMEEPMGELFFPGATVGYRKVTVSNLNRENVTARAAGKKVHEFYTAYDFPTFTKEIAIKKARRRPNPVTKFLKIRSYDYVSTSQGYMVELNDMHGKPKSVKEYQYNSDSPYSGVEYKYEQSSSNKISSSSYTMGKDGIVQKDLLGLEIDLFADARQSQTLNVSSSQNLNIDAFMAFIIPIIIPSNWPFSGKEELRYSSIVFNKVIKRHGILKETIYYDQQSKIGSQENILRDKESGLVILSKTEDRFGDALYTFNYPSYWAYDNMGPIYKDLKISVLGSNNASLNKYFHAGDQVSVYADGVLKDILWVASKSSSGLELIDKDGELVDYLPSDILTVVNPVKTNQQGENIGHVITKTNPLYDSNGDGIVESLKFNQVLNANVTEYTEQSSVFCNCDPATKGQPYNPYVEGVKGIWKPWRQFSYVTDRTQTRQNDNVNLRKDGLYKEFSPFWIINSIPGENWQKDPTNWVYTAEASIFNPYGKELESRDALGRYSAATFGYNNSLPTAVAQNARYKEVAFDGFEDYNTKDCATDHFSFIKVIPNDDNISEEESHTGKRSIKVKKGETYSLRKVLIECPQNGQNQ